MCRAVPKLRVRGRRAPRGSAALSASFLPLPHLLFKAPDMIRAQAIKTARLGISNFSTSALRLRQPRLVLYTGTDCQLCEVAKAVLDEAHREVRCASAVP